MTESTPSSAQIKTSADGRTGQVYFLFAASLLLVVILGTAAQSQSVRIGLALTELVLILLPAILFIRWKRLPVAEALRWRPIRPAIALLSVFVGITCWGVAAGIFVLSLPLLGEPPTVEALVPRTIPDLLWVLFCAALLPGICEETLFRGVIQGILRRKGQIKSVVITTLLFAVYHVNPWILLPAFFLGIVFGILVVRTGSTIPAILAHIAGNATAFTVSYFYHDRPETAAYVLMGGLAAACFVTFPAFWLFTRGADTGTPQLATIPAGLERPGVWLAGLIGGSVLMLIGVAIGAAFLFVGVHTVLDDKLEPEARRGDQLVIFKSGGAKLDLEVGDIISYRRDGETVFQRIVHIEAESVRIREEEGSEQRLLRTKITGKVVHVIKASEPSKPEGRRTPGKENTNGR